MKRFLIIAALFCCISTINADAQTDQRTLTTKIADLLAKVPYTDAAQSEKNMQAIADMGQKGIEEMSLMLAAPGKGDNTAVQYALNGFSYYTTKPGKGDLKKWSETAYLNALEKTSDKENKAFIIRQLQTTGSDASVASLKNYLSDERLCDPAARALVKINTPAAGKALLTALTASSGNNQLTLTEALGDMRYREAAPVIAKYTTSADNKLAKLALYSLAYIADPASEPVLAGAAAKSGFAYETTDATASYIKYAGQLAANGK
ncbi:MAG: HEAT repeat domain-containing protein, partial [Bacteroidota bacterium]